MFLKINYQQYITVGEWFENRTNFTRVIKPNLLVSYAKLLNCNFQENANIKTPTIIKKSFEFRIS